MPEKTILNLRFLLINAVCLLTCIAKIHANDNIIFPEVENNFIDINSNTECNSSPENHLKILESMIKSTSESTLSSYEKITSAEGFEIRKINITFDGLPADNEDFVRTHMRFSEGDSFNPHIANEAILSLHALGRFENIDISATQNQDKTINLFVDMTTRPKISCIKFPHERVSNKKLRKEMKTKSGGYLSRADVNEDILTIYRHYQTNGFPKPDIKFEIISQENGFAEVIFDIKPGENFNISDIKFHNFGDINTNNILKKMMLKTWSFFSFITKKGYFMDVLLDVDKQMITETMFNAGYLDAKLVSAEFISSENKKGILHFTADLGQKYFLGNITFDGNKIYDNKEIQNLLLIKKGDIFNPAYISEVAENIQNFYRYHGYINTYVAVQKIPTFQNNAIDINFTIFESPPFFVNAITINGNYKTKNKVILREIALLPGNKFNYISMKNSEKRLQNTGFFDSAAITDVPSDIPDHKDVRIDVKEAKTGKASIGGAISAKNSQILYLELSQSNFDLFNSHANFQGSGQKARARAQIGTRENQLTISFEEPYLFDRELAFGVDIFGLQTKYRKSDSNYSGATYDEKAIGFEPYFRKRLYELWVGRLGYNFTKSKISNVKDTAVQPLKDEAKMGMRTESSVKFSIERDARDNYIFPRTGSLISLNSQLSGVGGDINLLKLEASANKHFLVSEKYDHTLALVANIGTILPYKNQKTPYSKRYFLGGSNMMRGFESHAISPKDVREKTLANGKKEKLPGESLGGNSFLYGCAEYTFNIFDSFFGATFIEAGTVNENKMDFCHNFNVCAGAGLRIFINGMPLRLDWGFPIHSAKDTKKNGLQFNFSFGAAF